MKSYPSKLGFTLLEVLIVIVILGVLAGLAVPVYKGQVEKSRKAEAIRFLDATRESEMRYRALNNTYTNQQASLDFDPNIATGGQALHFAYNISIGNASQLVVRAKRNTLHGGDGSSAVYIDEKGNITGSGVFA